MKQKNLTNRQILAVQTKKKLYDTTARMLDTIPYNSLKIQDICKEAGVSVGTFYHYYETKQDILNDIYANTDAFFLQYVKSSLTKKNTAERLVEYFDFAAKRCKLKTVNFWEHSFDFAKVRQDLNSPHVLNNTRFLENIIEEGQKKGELSSESSPEDITHMLWVVYKGIIFDWCALYGNYDIEAYVHEVIGRFIQTYQKV